jgi:bifunctional ADP-heptose synthase (sugar kinase/adenylyltransferase)
MTTLHEIAQLAGQWRVAGKRVAIAVGEFDVLVPGQIRQLREAKADCGALVVLVAGDLTNIDTSRTFGALDRADQVRSLACVDEVLIIDEGVAEAMLLLEPDLLVIDEAWGRSLDRTDRQRLAELGSTVTVMHSGAEGQRRQARAAGVADELAAYGERLRARIRIEDVHEALRAVGSLRVVVLGDLIIDQYTYCRVSGTVTKYPALAAVFEHDQTMVGGSAAIARHAAQLAGEVLLVCAHGSLDDLGAVAEELLIASGVTTRFIRWPDTHTVTKRRYISGGYPNVLVPTAAGRVPASTRLFEVGYLPTGPLAERAEMEAIACVTAAAGKYDAAIVADFGHGFVTPGLVGALAAGTAWWAVNAQTNSSNYGFNRITKYRGADFVCIDELEARLPSGDRSGALDHVASSLLRDLETKELMVTRGRDGLILYSPLATEAAPAVATDVIDAVGAGDAVLTCASLCRAAGVSPELTVFLSSCAGATAAGIVGNEVPVGRESLLATAERVLT